MLRATVVVCGVLLGILLAGIAIASHHDILASLHRMVLDPWALVTLLDLGAGLLFVAAWIAVVEPRPWCAAGWIAALAVLGNVATLAYLLWRSRDAQRFSDLFLPPSRRSAGP
ncbi:MAG: DUF1475 family protein [Candidatus Competibacterales bacterium]|nr:DUF1475 family protein [Candidatus Competibacterales bacterium]